MGQLISAHSWMGRDEKPSSTLQKRLISSTLNFPSGYTTWDTEIQLVIHQFHSADFTLNVGSPRSLVLTSLNWMKYNDLISLVGCCVRIFGDDISSLKEIGCLFWCHWRALLLSLIKTLFSSLPNFEIILYANKLRFHLNVCQSCGGLGIWEGLWC